LPSRWIHERKNEHYHVKAKEEGYRSRASYKLLQIHNKFHIFENAKYVLDLGAAPGGWLQVASEKIGEDGIVVGVDLEEIRPFFNENIYTIVGDVTDPEVQIEIMRMFEGKFDVILSDMAPDVIGQWEVDHFRQIFLARNALKIADSLLKNDGWFIVKVFQGSEYPAFLRDMKKMFHYVKNFKPKASRKRSAELYMVAQNLKKNREFQVYREPVEEEEDEEPLPGDQLFEYSRD
jgi:23S rRNA (uridine2552-2'-O)-methyltransferase